MSDIQLVELYVEEGLTDDALSQLEAELVERGHNPNEVNDDYLVEMSYVSNHEELTGKGIKGFIGSFHDDEKAYILTSDRILITGKDLDDIVKSEDKLERSFIDYIAGGLFCISILVAGILLLFTFKIEGCFLGLFLLVIGIVYASFIVSRQKDSDANEIALENIQSLEVQEESWLRYGLFIIWFEIEGRSRRRIIRLRGDKPTRGIEFNKALRLFRDAGLLVNGDCINDS